MLGIVLSPSQAIALDAAMLSRPSSLRLTASLVSVLEKLAVFGAGLVHGSGDVLPGRVREDAACVLHLEVEGFDKVVEAVCLLGAVKAPELTDKRRG